MLVNRQWFGEEVSQVVCALPPLDAEVSLPDAIADPVKTHIHSFGALNFNSVVGHAHRTSIVGEEESWWRLRVAEELECGAMILTFLAIDVAGCVLGLTGRCCDDVNERTDDEDRAIDHGGLVEIAKVMNTACHAA